MAFTEKDMEEQRKAFAAIKDEFSRLNTQFDALLKENGLSSADLQQALAENHDPETKAFLEKTTAEAARAGQARAAHASSAPAKTSTAGRGRPGVVRL